MTNSSKVEEFHYNLVNDELDMHSGVCYRVLSAYQKVSSNTPLEGIRDGLRVLTEEYLPNIYSGDPLYVISYDKVRYPSHEDKNLSAQALYGKYSQNMWSEEYWIDKSVSEGWTVVLTGVPAIEARNELFDKLLELLDFPERFDLESHPELNVFLFEGV